MFCVIDNATGELVRVVDGTNEVVATVTSGLDNFAFDANDRVFVSSAADGFVKRINADGSITTLQEGGMVRPGGISVGGDTVWAADVFAIRGFDRTTGEQTVYQHGIFGISEQGTSFNLSVDGDNLILASYFDNEVRVWNPATQERVEHYPGLQAPVSAVRYAGGMAIAEFYLAQVKWYQGEDEPVLLGTGLGGVADLYVSGDSLYASDTLLGQIWRIAEAGAPLAEPEVIVDGLEGPEGFIVTENGIVVVEGAAGRVIYIDAAGERRILANIPGSPSGLPIFPPSSIFNDVDIDSDGNLFVSGDVDRVIYRIQAPW